MAVLDYVKGGWEKVTTSIGPTLGKVGSGLNIAHSYINSGTGDLLGFRSFEQYSPLQPSHLFASGELDKYSHRQGLIGEWINQPSTYGTYRLEYKSPWQLWGMFWDELLYTRLSGLSQFSSLFIAPHGYTNVLDTGTLAQIKHQLDTNALLSQPGQDFLNATKAGTQELTNSLRGILTLPPTEPGDPAQQDCLEAFESLTDKLDRANQSLIDTTKEYLKNNVNQNPESLANGLSQLSTSYLNKIQETKDQMKLYFTYSTDRLTPEQLDGTENKRKLTAISKLETENTELSEKIREKTQKITDLSGIALTLPARDGLKAEINELQTKLDGNSAKIQQYHNEIDTSRDKLLTDIGNFQENLYASLGISDQNAEVKQEALTNAHRQLETEYQRFYNREEFERQFTALKEHALAVLPKEANAAFLRAVSQKYNPTQFKEAQEAQRKEARESGRGEATASELAAPDLKHFKEFSTQHGFTIQKSADNKLSFNLPYHLTHDIAAGFAKTAVQFWLGTDQKDVHVTVTNPMIAQHLYVEAKLQGIEIHITLKDPNTQKENEWTPDTVAEGMLKKAQAGKESQTNTMKDQYNKTKEEITENIEKSVETGSTARFGK